jgi:PucR C-terminal helix-turn-helix domain
MAAHPAAAHRGLLLRRPGRRLHDGHRALAIHPNTLLYRIRRFEQISGRSLASTEALAEVWLAMRTTAAMPSGLAFRL